jgi:UDP-galactopyranose mutase
VRIASTPEEFVAAAEAAMAESAAARLERVDAFLADVSWDRTFGRMRHLVETALEARAELAASDEELAAG